MKNIYLFYGEEEFLMKEELDPLKKEFQDPSDPFGIETIEGTASTLEQIINTISSAPMLGGKRMVLILDLFKDKKKTKEIMANVEKLIDSLKNVPQDTTVIFQQVGNVDKRLKLVKFLNEKAVVKEFKPFAFWEQDKVIDWVLGTVKQEEKRIEEQTAELLINIVGTNLRLLKNEIDKLITYIGDKDQIQMDDVKKVASSGEYDSFSLSNSIRARKVNESLNSLSELFKDKQSPIMIIGMLAKLYRMLLQVKSMERKGMDQYDMARTLGAKPFFVKKHLENTRSFSSDELKHGLRKLHKSDLKIKSGSNQRVELELLVTALCKKGV